MASRQSSLAPKSISGNPLAIQNTPPPNVTLPYFAASFIGLIATGAELYRAGPSSVADPTSDPTAAVAHLALLATLSMGILGALHQFTPVMSTRKLRSTLLTRATFISWLFGSWSLPIGFASGNEAFVVTGGTFAGIAVVTLVSNLWIPLLVKGKGTPIIGLRLALLGLVATGCIGALYVSDRSNNWFALNGHTVLAHATIGIFAWLGLTYLSVSEKLWPMFFLAHLQRKSRAGLISVLLVPFGTSFLAAGLLLSNTLVATMGAIIICGGLASHLRSQYLHIKNRKRKADLYLVQVVTASIWLGIGVVFAIWSKLVIRSDSHFATLLAAASLTCFTGWVLQAFIAHLHKVIPFILWSTYRNHKITKTRSGAQLVFGDFYSRILATVIFTVSNLAIVGVATGFASGSSQLLAISGLVVAATGILLLINFSVRPIAIYRSSKLAH